MQKLAAACAGVLLLLPGVGTASGLAAVHVHQESIAFDPATVTILVGEAVDWDNHDLVTHTVTADDGSFDSGDMGNGAVYQRAFTAAGTYAYHCVYHVNSGMKGKVLVSDPTALPDLTVAGIEGVDLLPGVTKQLNVTIRNLGLHAAGASKASVAYQYQGQLVPVGDIEVPLLGPGESFVGKLQWNTLGKLGDFTVQAIADAAEQVGEGDEGNNVGTAVVAVLVPGVPGIDLLDPVRG